jgi:hypothetical protein
VHIAIHSGGIIERCNESVSSCPIDKPADYLLCVIDSEYSRVVGPRKVNTREVSRAPDKSLSSRRIYELSHDLAGVVDSKHYRIGATGWCDGFEFVTTTDKSLGWVTRRNRCPDHIPEIVDAKYLRESASRDMNRAEVCAP